MGVPGLLNSRSTYDENKSWLGDRLRNWLTKKEGNPNPNNYKILKYLEFNNGRHLLLEIQYPDANNYEGRKILVFENCRLIDLLEQKTIDPHFSNNPNFKSPIARFEPTNKGWEMGKLLILNLND